MMTPVRTAYCWATLLLLVPSCGPVRGGALTPVSAPETPHHAAEPSASWVRYFAAPAGPVVVNDLLLGRSGELRITGWAGDIDFGTGALPCAQGAFVATFDTSGTVRWAQCTESNAGGGVAEDSAGRVVVVGGSVTSPRAVTTEVYDSLGHLLSQASMPSSSATTLTWARAVTIDSHSNRLVVGAVSDGSINLGGATIDAGSGGTGFLVAFDPADHALWTHALGVGGENTAEAIALRGDDGVVVAGDFQGKLTMGGTTLTNDTPHVLMYLASLGADGKSEWLRAIGNVGVTVHAFAHAVSIGPTGDVFLTGQVDGTIDFGGGVTVVGGSDPDGADRVGFVVAFDSAGRAQWVKRTTKAGRMSDVATDPKGNVYVGGNNGDLHGLGTPFIKSWSSTGDSLSSWHPKMGAEASAHVTSIATDAAGNVYAAGDFIGSVDFGEGPHLSSNTERPDLFLVKVSF